MLSYLFRIVSIRLANEVQAVRGQDLALVPLLAQPHEFVIVGIQAPYSFLFELFQLFLLIWYVHITG